MTSLKPILAVCCALAVLLAACGEAAGIPSAQEILAKPNHANLRDAHFQLSGTFSSNGKTVNLSGDGDVVYKSATPAGHFSFTSTAAGHPVHLDDIYINGVDYSYSPQDGKWIARPSVSGLGPTSFSGASDFEYLGEDDLPQGRAWHARAKDKVGNAFEGWIRESDGYPLQYRLYTTSSKLTTTMMLTFERFNTGVTIAAPPASSVVQG